MIFKNPMQLKAHIKNWAHNKNLSASLVLQHYLLERLLERIALSNYQRNFIIKGGFLIAAIVGLDTRATMDLDTTIKGIALSQENLEAVFQDICSIQLNDQIELKLSSISPIREKDSYPGYRIHLIAIYPPIKTALTVDVTTGDIVTPKEIRFDFPLLFEDRSINLLAYNLETILAEKIETILSRNVSNSRPRDFYDIYILFSMYKAQLNPQVFEEALERTTKRRNSQNVLIHKEEILTSISNSVDLRRHWSNYQSNFSYAREINFEQLMSTLSELLSNIEATT